ncbi:MAG: hypothetical protein M1818_003482 [Claussenomyces sp. TS43310]|nr:MAG: hypothetical protein M1818_003482 [Claussenomyces sp. TS43310]
MVFGVVGMLVASRGSYMGMVIGGQVLSGIGLALGYLAITLTAEIVLKKYRPQIGAGAGISGMVYFIGALIERAFMKHNVGGIKNGWRGGFNLGAGFYAIAFVLILFFYHPAPRPNPKKLSILNRVLKIDRIGVFLVAAGLTLFFLVGLQYGGNPYPWKPATLLANMIIGAVLLVLFGI